MVRTGSVRVESEPPLIWVEPLSHDKCHWISKPRGVFMGLFSGHVEPFLHDTPLSGMWQRNTTKCAGKTLFASSPRRSDRGDGVRVRTWGAVLRQHVTDILRAVHVPCCFEGISERMTEQKTVGGQRIADAGIVRLSGEAVP